MTIKEVKRLHELAVATDYANYITTETDIYSVVETPDPPDAILKSTDGKFVWIEITDVFRSEKEARDAYSFATGGDYQRPQEVIIEPDKMISYSTVEGVERKLDKISYRGALDKHGKGVLVLWIYDPLFTNSTLERVKKEFDTQSLTSDYFKEVYIYWPDTTSRKFERIL